MFDHFNSTNSSLPSIVSSPLSASDHSSRFPDGVSLGATRKHERYYFADGNVILLVEGVLYNVHRYFFMRDSSNFAKLFSIPFGGFGEGLTDDLPIHLVNIKVHDFDLFLSILYPAEFGIFAADTVGEWTSVLDLADKWNFKSIRTLAIRELAPRASPVDKIVLGRKYQINEWLGKAYRNVCMRQDPLTNEEGMRLGMDDVIKISSIMICYGHDSSLAEGIRSRSSLSNEELDRHFGLDSRVHQPIHTEIPVDVPVANSEGPRKGCDVAPVAFNAPFLPQSPDPEAVNGGDIFLDANGELLTVNAKVMHKRKKEKKAKEKADREPLTVNAKAAQKRKEKKEKEKADRESQELLENEMAKETNFWD